ncbi:MAG: hypothetical protein ACOWWO_07945 [Peptococcaceae bacterium]
MFKSYKKIMVSIFVFIIMLAILMGVYHFYKQYFVNQPLSVTLDNSDFIADYTIVEEGEKPVLRLELNKTRNLQHDFLDFLHNSQKLIEEKSLTVEITTRPNESLLTMYQQIHPAVYEALEIGNYTSLQDRLQKINKELILTRAELAITDDFLLLQLEDGDAYLYCVFNKGENSTPKILNVIGSGKA